MFQTDFEALRQSYEIKIYCRYKIIRVITIMLDKIDIRNKSIYNTLY